MGRFEKQSLEKKSVIGGLKWKGYRKSIIHRTLVACIHIQMQYI
jgi:hypothetical protein